MSLVINVILMWHFAIGSQFYSEPNSILKLQRRRKKMLLEVSMGTSTVLWVADCL